MPSIIRYGASDLALADNRRPRVSALAQAGGAAFNPLSLSPTVWLKADASDNTLNLDQYACTGTVAQSGTTAVVGTGTAFLSEVVVGDELRNDDESITGIVVSITDNTHLTLDNGNGNDSGQGFTVVPRTGVNDRISQLTDQSGNGNHVTQSTASARPAKIPNVKNGLAVARFDANNDTMTKSFTSLAQPNTIFVVSKFSDTGTSQKVFDGLVGRNLLEIGTVGGSYNMYAGSFVFGGASAPNTSWHIHSLVFNGASSAKRLDGVEQATGDAGAQGLGGLRLGADTGGTVHFLNGDIGELIVFNSLLSAGNIALVETYLATRWGITVS